jgi:hypothetical protein
MKKPRRLKSLKCHFIFSFVNFAIDVIIIIFLFR